MTSLYDKLILGHYENKKQAYSNPTKWPWVNILYTKIKPDVLELKQWYNYDGEEKPYRHYHITFRYEYEDTVFTKAHNLLTDKEGCEMQWGYFAGTWYGAIKGECIVRDTKVVSAVEFDGTNYRSIDTGYNIETGKFSWGKEPSEGFFTFTKLNNSRILDVT